MKKGFPLDAPRSVVPRRLFLGCLVAFAALLLISGCSDEENTDVTQIPYPEPPTTPWFHDVWGTGPDDVYVVGQPGAILHWNGAAWSLVDVSAEVLTAVWGTGPGTIYAVGHGGAILRGSGTSWSSMTSGTEENFYDVGQGPYDAIYAVGEKGVIRALQGNTWAGADARAFRYNDDDVPEDTLDFAEDIQSLTTVGRYALAGDLAAVLMENEIPGYDHQWLWGPIEDPSRTFLWAGTSGAAFADNYLANKQGRLFQLVDDPADGLTWRRVTDPAGNEARPIISPQPITGLWLDATNARILMTTSTGRLASLQRDGTGSELLYADTVWLSAVWGAGNGEIWACGKNGLVLYSDDDAATWTALDVPLPEIPDKWISPDGKFGRLDP